MKGSFLIYGSILVFVAFTLGIEGSSSSHVVGVLLFLRNRLFSCGIDTRGWIGSCTVGVLVLQCTSHLGEFRVAPAPGSASSLT